APGADLSAAVNYGGFVSRAVKNLRRADKGIQHASLYFVRRQIRTGTTCHPGAGRTGVKASTPIIETKIWGKHIMAVRQIVLPGSLELLEVAEARRGDRLGFCPVQRRQEQRCED